MFEDPNEIENYVFKSFQFRLIGFHFFFIFEFLSYLFILKIGFYFSFCVCHIINCFETPSLEIS